MRPKINVVALAVIIGAPLATPSLLRAQDRIEVTVAAPALGAIPPLTAGTFLINTPNQSGIGGSGAVATGVEMSLPWGAEAIQFLQALETGATANSVTCAFYHTGNSAPYYTVTLHTPVVREVALAYDSAAGIASEEIHLLSFHIDYAAGASGAPATTSPPTIAPHVAMIGGRQVHVLPSRSIALTRIASTAAAPGAPAEGFASFTSPTGAMPSEGGIPSWAGSQSTSVSKLVVDVQSTLNIGSQSTGSGAGRVTVSPVTLTKPVGSLSAQLQAARANRTPITTVISLADRPGRLAYRITVTNGLIANDQTSFSGAKSTEEITMNAMSIQFEDLVRGTKVTLH